MPYKIVKEINGSKEVLKNDIQEFEQALRLLEFFVRINVNLEQDDCVLTIYEIKLKTKHENKFV